MAAATIVIHGGPAGRGPRQRKNRLFCIELVDDNLINEASRRNSEQL